MLPSHDMTLAHEAHGVNLLERHDIVEAVLDPWSAALGPARDAYRGHVYRVFHAARWLLRTERHDALLATAAAFHDLGIWSDATFDYLLPSARRAEQYAREHGQLDAALVALVVEQHHRLRRYVEGPSADVVEAFRRADMVDLSRGWLSAGLERARLRELVAVFPYAGFHRGLVRIALAWWVRHPLRPLPMMRL